jgi:hypothetical protein
VRRGEEDKRDNGIDRESGLVLYRWALRKRQGRAETDGRGGGCLALTHGAQERRVRRVRNTKPPSPREQSIANSRPLSGLIARAIWIEAVPAVR